MNLKRIALVTLVAGVLDILSAFFFASLNGGSPARVLAVVASGPFGAGIAASPLAPAIGLAVHFGIMVVMVAFFAWVTGHWSAPIIRLGPLLAGIGYGILLYVAMYWIVLPLRWPTVHPQLDLEQVAKALFAHIVCVGLPIAYLLVPREAAAARPAEA
jgi:hypothetical protein